MADELKNFLCRTSVRKEGGRAAVPIAILAFAAFAATQIYLSAKVLDVSDGQDFRLIWLAGHLWASGANPYSEAFDRLYLEIFGAQLSGHFWVYPPYWFVPSTMLGSMKFETSLLVWNVTSHLAIWISASCIVASIRLEGILRRITLLLALVAIASTMQATPFAISIGQTSLLLFAGIAVTVCGYLRRWPVLLCAGLILALLKPQAGLLLVTFALIQGWTARPAIAALAIVAAATVPAFLVAGFGETLTGFLDNVARYNGAEAVANLPEHLVGIQKILSLGGLSMGSTPLILASVAGILAARLLRVDGRTLLGWSIVAILLMSGLHSYDLTLALCLVPFLSPRSWRGWAALAGLALLFRPSNIAPLLIPVGALDSGIFPGSVHATTGLVLLAFAMIPERSPPPSD